MFKASQRIQEVQVPIIPIIGQLIQENPGTISLGQGVVYYSPPDSILEEIQRCLSDPANHLYKEVEGIPELLDTITTKLLQDNHIQVSDQQRIVATAGGNLAYSNAIFAITDPGDEIILPTPYYFNHEMAVVIADGIPVCVPVDSNYQLDLDLLKAAITPKTRAIVTVSPNNPSGAIYSEESLRAVNALCKESGIYHISDEAYEYFTYEGESHFSPASIADSEAHTISIYSLSKSFGFAAWRMGYMLIPAALFESVLKIQDTQLICSTVVSQYAALAAMKAGRSYIAQKTEVIKTSRNIFWRELQSIQDICTAPYTKGAFYFLLKIDTDMDSFTMAKRLIQEHKVAAIPGSAFGLTDGCYLRIAYGAMPSDQAEAGIKRLVKGIRELVGKV